MAVAFTRSEQPGTEEATLFYGNERDADTLSIKEDGVRPVEDRNQALFSWETRSLVRRRILQIVIGFLGVAIIVCIILAFTLNVSDGEYTNLGNARFQSKNKSLQFKNSAGKYVLSAEIGLNLSSELVEKHTQASLMSKYITSDGVTLVLTQETEFSFVVNWTSSSEKPIVFTDCFVLSSGSHWYGGSELLQQKWPMESVQINMGQYVPRSTSSSKSKSAQTFGSVLERYWLNGHGVAILVDSSVPLHVSSNANGDKKLCLKSDTDGYLQPAVSYLGYRVLSGYNPRDLHLMVINKYLGKPSIIPNPELIEKPTWLLGNYSEKHLESLTEKILLLKYTCGNIVIGGLHGDTGSNDPKMLTLAGQMSMINVNKLKSIGCNVSMNVHPYLRVSSPKFTTAAKEGFLVKDCGGKVPGLIMWRDSYAACIDVTHKPSNDWFKRNLVDLQMKYGVNSFEFNGGNIDKLPSCYQFHNKTMDPGHYSSEYAKFAARMKGINVDVGYHTQKLPIFVKMDNKDSTWDDLKMIIPTVLTFGIMGYPYVLPSVVGGNHGNVDKDLYIRWMQLNVFLPGVQLSKAPWEFDKETVSIVQDLLKLRSTLTPIIVEAFQNVTKTGAPVIRPMWWVAPMDPYALQINFQFMLGDTYLVVPILEKNKTEQNVYLPVGQWEEQFGNHTVYTNQDFALWVKPSVDLKTVLYYKCLALYN